MAKKATTGEGKTKRSSSASRTPERHVLIPDRVNPEDELTHAFDPMQDMHLWTMWRSAVTGKIVEETKAFEESDFRQHPYGKSIVQIPLQRLIRLEPDSWEVAQRFMNPFRRVGSDGTAGSRRPKNPSSSQGSPSRRGALGTVQFVFFGVPRAVLKK